jgi:hypothetical protein
LNVEEKTRPSLTTQSPFLIAEEAAQWLRVTPSTLARWRGKPGDGPRYFQPGGPNTQVLYRLSDLEEWVARGRVGEVVDEVPA